MLIAATSIAGLLVYYRRDAMARAWQMWRRMRWLLLSLLVLYGWYTPGDPLIPAWGAWSPSQLGLQVATVRCAALLLLGGAVALLLATTPMPSLLAGLMWVTAPLQRIGFPYQRFALRVALTLQAVTILRADTAVVATPSGARLGRIAEVMSARYQAVLCDAALQPEQEITVPLCGAPTWYHWLLPFMIGLLLLF